MESSISTLTFRALGFMSQISYLKSTLILFSKYLRTDSKRKLLKLPLFLIFQIKNFMRKTVTAFLKEISLEGEIVPPFP